MWRSLVVIVTAAFAAGPDAAGDCPVKAPWVTLNLDLAPVDRWRTIASSYRDELLALVAWQRKAVHDFGREDLVNELLRVQHVDAEYLEEMQGIVQAVAAPSQLELRDLLLWNLNYELGTPQEHGAGCTAVLALDSSGRMLHGRNDDLPERAVLTPVTLGVSVVRGGQEVFKMAVFLGAVGTDTALSLGKPSVGGWSVSRNAMEPPRQPLESTAWIAASVHAAGKGGLVANIALRSAMERLDTITFDEAVSEFLRLPLTAPQYFALAGSSNGTVLSLQRVGDGSPDVYSLDPSSGRWFIVQTNLDHAASHGPGDKRRTAAEKAVEAVGRSNLDASRLFEVMSTYGVRDNITTLTWISSASLQQTQHSVPQLVVWPVAPRTDAACLTKADGAWREVLV